MIKTRSFVDHYSFLRHEAVTPLKSVFTHLINQSTDSPSILRKIIIFNDLSSKSYENLSEDYGYELDTTFGPYILLTGDENFFLYYDQDKKLKIADNNFSNINNPINTSFEEIISFLKQVHGIYQRFEQPETFKVYPNMLQLVQDRYFQKLEALGFRCVGQTEAMVRFAKDWLFVDLLEDRDGAVLFFTDQRNNERYDFNMALELLDWDAGNMHALLCQKYKLKLNRDEARTGTMEATFEYLESHFKEILQTLDEAFFTKLEEERQLRTEMLRRVLLLPNDHIIRRLFVDGSPVWWEYMRQEMNS